VSANKFTIGRDKECDVAIADDSVSRVHAELTMLDGGKILLADRGSSNGTCIMQAGTPRRIDQAYVLPSDRVQFGSVVLPVSELMEAILDKISHTPGKKIPPSMSGKLIRCECGAIKSAGARCAGCGQ